MLNDHESRVTAQKEMHLDTLGSEFKHSYSFELQVDRALAFERDRQISLERLSDWNCDAADVALPNGVLALAMERALSSVTKYAETAVAVQTADEVRHNLVREYLIDLPINAHLHLLASGTQAMLAVAYALKQLVADPAAVIIHPSYFSVQDSLELFDIRCHHAWRRQATRFAIDPTDIAGACENRGANIVVITEPVYSVGRCLTASEWDLLIEVCERRDLWLVIDMAFSGLAWDSPGSSWIHKQSLERLAYPKLIIIDAPSKRLFTNNIKLGIVLATGSVIEHLRQCSDWYLGNLTGLQLEFARALFAPENRAQLESLSVTNANLAKTHYGCLSNVLSSCHTLEPFRPDAGFHAMVFEHGSVSRDIDAMSLCHRIAESYLALVIPSNDFAFHSGDEFGFRINLMRPPSRWGEILARMAQEGLPR